MRTSALFDAKNRKFFEIYGVSAWTRERGLSQCGHFSNKGINVPRFCANVLYGRPLIDSESLTENDILFFNESLSFE